MKAWGKGMTCVELDIWCPLYKSLCSDRRKQQYSRLCWVTAACRTNLTLLSHTKAQLYRLSTQNEAQTSGQVTDPQHQPLNSRRCFSIHFQIYTVMFFLNISRGSTMLFWGLIIWVIYSPTDETLLQQRRCSVAYGLIVKGEGASSHFCLPPVKVWWWQRAALGVSVGQRPWAAGCPQRLRATQHRQMG